MLKIALALALVATASAQSLTLRDPSTQTSRSLTWDGQKLTIPEHTDKIAALEATWTSAFATRIEDAILLVGQLDDAFKKYKIAQKAEDHNTVNVAALQTQVDALQLDVTKTPLNHHAFTCDSGTVDSDARKCTCDAEKYGGGTYVSGTAYPICEVCDYLTCLPNLYQAGACSTDAGNNYSCNLCTCDTDKYQSGACGGNGANKRNNNYACNDCDNASCDTDKYQSGACGGDGANKRNNNYVCNDCDNQKCDAHSEYRTGNCGGRTNGYQCNKCENSSCPAGSERGGTCDATTKGFSCHTCEANEYTYDHYAGAEYKMVFHKAGTGGNGPDDTVDGSITGLVPGARYNIDVEILRNDLGHSSEYVKSILVGGEDMGSCNPDGGDYDCTFYKCQGLKSGVRTASESGTIPVRLVYTGNSWDCDCDTNTWDCSKQSTVSGRTAMEAVARFTVKMGVPTCKACDNVDCGSGYRKGSCSGTNNGYTCHACPTGYTCDGITKTVVPCAANYCNNAVAPTGNLAIGCSCACPGRSTDNPAESTRYYSSIWDNNAKGTGHAASALDSSQGWSAEGNAANSWMQLDLGSDKTVNGIVVQKRTAHSQWVKSVTVQE